jgi:anti-sigma-K factor RskA
MNHEAFQDQLDDYVDGALSGAERAAMEAHAAACAPCAASLAQLRALLGLAQQLPPGAAPERDLWTALRERLVAAEPEALRPGAAPASRWWARAWRPAVGVAAAAAAVVFLALCAWLSQRGPREAAVDTAAPRLESTPATAETAVLTPTLVAALARECMGAGRILQASMESRNDPADEALTHSLTAGIEVVDRSIAETVAALEKNPGNVSLLKLVTLRYQQKLALLHSAMEIVEEV